MLTTMTMHLLISATLDGPLHSEGSAYSSARQSAAQEHSMQVWLFCWHVCGSSLT